MIFASVVGKLRVIGIGRRCVKKRKKMDPKLVSKLQRYEVRYIAKKFGISQLAVRQIISVTGHTRWKIYLVIKAAQS